MNGSQKIIIFILVFFQILFLYLCWYSKIPFHLPILFLIIGFVFIKSIFDCRVNKKGLSLSWRIFYFSIYICFIYATYLNLIKL